VAHYAHRQHLDALSDTLVLVTSELVSNAVRHAARVVRVELLEHPGHVTVRVTDDGPGAPRVIDPEPYGESGRGLMIVDGLTSRWGTEPTEEGKVVWAELVI